MNVFKHKIKKITRKNITTHSPKLKKKKKKSDLLIRSTTLVKEKLNITKNYNKKANRNEKKVYLK